MNYVKLVETINYALQITNATNRQQMKKAVIYELKSVVVDIKRRLGEYSKKPSILILIDNLLYAIDATENMTLTVLPETMKDEIGDKLQELKEEICLVSYRVLLEQNIKFRVNEQLKKILREVVTVAVRRGYIS